MQEMKEFSSWIETIKRDRRWLSRCYYGWVIFVMLIEYFGRRLIHQLGEPVLFSPAVDNTYWLLHLMGIPQFIASNYTAEITFEVIFLLTTASCFLAEERFRMLPILFTLEFLIYLVTKNSVVAHQEHGVDALFLMSFIFWTGKETRFSLLLQAFRYYVHFIFISAACWKLFRGSAFLPQQMSEILKSQHLAELSEPVAGTRLQFIIWLINHPSISHGLLLAVVAVQLSFLTGFFTKKFDRWLLLFFFLFYLGDWFVMGLSFYQSWVAALVFLPWSSLQFTSVTHSAKPLVT